MRQIRIRNGIFRCNHIDDFLNGIFIVHRCDIRFIQKEKGSCSWMCYEWLECVNWNAERRVRRHWLQTELQEVLWILTEREGCIQDIQIETQCVRAFEFA